MELNPPRRFEYIDFCKVFAMFLVTFSHCAQQLSGCKFPDLVVSKDSFISINMAIFMISSGFVINLERMRAASIKEYLMSKFYRLIIPMTSWYIIMCLVSSQQPSWTIYWSTYWYLGAMFVCLSTIKILTCFLSNNLVLALVSVLLLSCVPLISFERSCYMIPFLWVGYLLRSYIGCIGKTFTLILLIGYIVMYYCWDVRYSIYISPFHIWNMNLHSVFSLFFRFLIGVVGTIVVISVSRLLINRDGFRWMRYIAKYGPYTLVFYTMSFVLNAVLARFLWHINLYIITPGLLDAVAVIVTTFMMIGMYYFQILTKKNRWFRLFLLGES